MMVPIDIDFHSIEKQIRKSMETIKYTTFFRVKQKKWMYTGLEQLEGE